MHFRAPTIIQTRNTTFSSLFLFPPETEKRRYGACRASEADKQDRSSVARRKWCARGDGTVSPRLQKQQQEAAVVR